MPLYLYSMFPKKLSDKIDKRKADNSFRTLTSATDLIDFSSNDYLGFSRSKKIYERALKILEEFELKTNGSTGSRLLTGNHALYPFVESQLSRFFNSEASLIFNSGYDANLGFFSSVPQRDDIILYDELIHASIRDGLALGKSKSLKFKHNDLVDLEKKLKNYHGSDIIYIVTELVFSMDGDSPDLVKMAEICDNYDAKLIVDEAHAIGIIGDTGKGLTDEVCLKNRIFARIITFGKALGCHGAAILGSHQLKDYLINFSRSFIYTTALSPHALATISAALQYLQQDESKMQLKKNIEFFKLKINSFGLGNLFIKSDSAIQSCILPGNEPVRSISEKLREKGFNVKPILYPTVARGQERLRFCIHSYNTEEEIEKMLSLVANFELWAPKI